MNYKLVDNRIEFTDEKLTENSTNMISVISTYKFTKYMEQMPDGISILRSNETRYTKLDVKNKYLQGVIYMPSKKDIFNHTRFGYLIFNRNILFIDSSDTVINIIEQLRHSSIDMPTIWKFYYHFLNMLIDRDLLYLQDIENSLSTFENNLLDGGIDEYNQRDIIYIRKKLFNQYRFYTQLFEIEHKLNEVDHITLTPNEDKLFDLFSNRVSVLRSEAQILRDYSMQIQDLYESQISVHQNDIMKILTIVTTLVLPLSLIAGWYGMNFKYMPELTWKYGYQACIGLSILVIVGSLYLFKKNKFL